MQENDKLQRKRCRTCGKRRYTRFMVLMYENYNPYFGYNLDDWRCKDCPKTPGTLDMSNLARLDNSPKQTPPVNQP